MKTKEIEKHIESYEKELEKLKRKYGLDPIVTIEFPQYRALPEEVLLALKVLQNHDYKFMLTYNVLKEKPNGH